LEIVSEDAKTLLVLLDRLVELVEIVLEFGEFGPNVGFR
jgi:predicted ATP-dependent Lon-type protease